MGSLSPDLQLDFPETCCSLTQVLGTCRVMRRGAVAQLGECLTGSQEVAGSIPASSTNCFNKLPPPIPFPHHLPVFSFAYFLRLDYPKPQPPLAWSRAQNIGQNPRLGDFHNNGPQCQGGMEIRIHSRVSLTPRTCEDKTQQGIGEKLDLRWHFAWSDKKRSTSTAPAVVSGERTHTQHRVATGKSQNLSRWLGERQCYRLRVRGVVDVKLSGEELWKRRSWTG